MGVDNPVERAIEFGKDPKISQEKKKKGSDMKIRLQEKESLKKLQKEQMAKIIEDILLGNKKKKDFVKKNNKPEVLSKGEIMDLIKSKSGIENKSKVIKSSSEQ
jgi:anthranilate phosphoribosyltransferase